jgi:Fe2+ or Zn2+ uptake regulation protein
MSDSKTMDADLLSVAGIRPTRERRLLLRIIGANPHLDAAEIFQLARKENPRIGLATVYRTLRTLSESGVIESSGLGQDHSHFEVRRRDHLHLVCSECGKVLDIPAPFDSATIGAAHGFTITRSNLEVVGLCKSCRRSRSQAESRTSSNRP